MAANRALPKTFFNLIVAGCDLECRSAMCFTSDRFCAGFRMPACRDHPHARTAGVREAPRHEIAGCGAPTVQRVLWGFGVGVSVGEVEPTLAIGSL